MQSIRWAELVQRCGATSSFEIRDFRGNTLGSVEVTEATDCSWQWVRLDVEDLAGVIRREIGRQLTAFQAARRAWAISEDVLPTDLPSELTAPTAPARVRSR